MKRTTLRPVSAKRLALLRQEGGSLRRTALKAGPGLERRGRVNPVNRKRRAKNYAKRFGPKADWIRSLDCIVPGCWERPIHAAHAEHSTGAGGDSRHLLPMCATHHLLDQHVVGVKSFAAKHGLDLAAMAARFEAEWQERAPAALREHEARERELEQIEGAA